MTIQILHITATVLIIGTIALKIATAWIRRKQKHHKSRLP